MGCFLVETKGAFKVNSSKKRISWGSEELACRNVLGSMVMKLLLGLTQKQPLFHVLIFYAGNMFTYTGEGPTLSLGPTL